MRKLSIAAMTAIAVLALAGVALAANVYTVDGSTKPGGKGSKSSPMPIQLKFDFQVESDDPSVRGTPIEQLRDRLRGSRHLSRSCSRPARSRRPTGTAASRSACKKAKVGGGLVQNVVGRERPRRR